MEIRPANKPDYVEIAAMLSLALGEPYTPAGLMNAVYFDEDFDPNLVLVAREKGVTLGYIAGVIKSFRDQPEGFIKLLGVKPGRQGQGLGRELVERLEERFSDEGAKAVRVAACPPHFFFAGVPETAEAALRLFTRLGYRQAEGGLLARVRPFRAPFDTAPFTPKPDDFQRADALALASAPAWSAAVEEAFSYEHPRAVLTPAGEAAGLCLFQPGESVGPLLVQQGLGIGEALRLIQAAASAASSAPLQDERGLALRQDGPAAEWRQALLLEDPRPCFSFAKAFA